MAQDAETLVEILGRLVSERQDLASHGHVAPDLDCQQCARKSELERMLGLGAALRHIRPAEDAMLVLAQEMIAAPGPVPAWGLRLRMLALNDAVVRGVLVESLRVSIEHRQKLLLDLAELQHRAADLASALRTRAMEGYACGPEISALEKAAQG